MEIILEYYGVNFPPFEKLTLSIRDSIAEITQFSNIIDLIISFSRPRIHRERFLKHLRNRIRDSLITFSNVQTMERLIIVLTI